MACPEMKHRLGKSAVNDGLNDGTPVSCGRVREAETKIAKIDL